MFGYLKQSTASQSRMVGPFIDDTDFKTVETGLTIANTDVKLSKNGAAGANKNSGGGTHRNNGMYSLAFDATDTDTVGELEGSILVSGALVVVFKFTVLEEVIYDALLAASAAGYLQPTVLGRTLDVTANGNAGIDWGNLENPGTSVNLSATIVNLVNTLTTYTGNTPQTGDSYARIGVAGAGLTNINLPNQTMDITGSLSGSVGSVSGNVGGNVTGSVGSVLAGVTVSTNSDKTGYSISGSITTLDGLKNFDPAADPVANVTLCATTTALTNVINASSVVASVTGSVGSVTGGATSAAQTTAQNDLDIITGADGAILLSGTQASVDAIEADTSTTLPALIDDLAVKKNTAFPNFEFLMVLTSDGRTPATGLIVTGQRSIDGASFTGVAGTIAEVSNGIYQFDALAADTNGDVITWRFSSATADDTFITLKTVA